MTIIKTTLEKDLKTAGGLKDAAIRVKTAYMEPREELNPGELLCAALGACMMTKVGFVASKRGDAVEGTEVLVEPVFDEKHTRIMEMNLTFKFPYALTNEQKAFYVQAAQNCPVHNSLREDISFNVRIQ